MSNTLIGRKLGMTQVYDSNNCLVPVTVVEAGPCPVVQVKTEKTDGYNALQLGFSPQKASRLSNAELGHLKKASVEPVSQLREVRADEAPSRKAGDLLTVTLFNTGDKIDVVGVTKGKGFQGVVKRYRMGGGSMSHGSMHHRRVGSIGANQSPGHVFKNKKMPGHMGQRRRTVQNLSIVRIVEDKNLLLVQGSIPGATGDYVIIRSAKKARK